MQAEGIAGAPVRQLAMTTGSLFLAVAFGSLGFGYLLYGRRQRSLVTGVCGLLLLIVPYVIASTVPLLLVGGVLAALPFFVRR